MKLPWGYKEVRVGCRIADKSYAEITQRHALGESAIALLELLGVPLEMQELVMEAVDEGKDALTVLTELQGEKT